MLNHYYKDMSEKMWDCEDAVDQLVREYDQTMMPLPDIECEPQLLISKVRKHYMEYLIKLLSVNYETNQRLLNKNIYLPSAIWRCAKSIETAAAQACMVVELYRKSIIPVVKELKNDTQKGKLNKKLYDCLRIPPGNEKNTQTSASLMEDCDCTCNKIQKRRRTSGSPKSLQMTKNVVANENTNNTTNKIPILINSQVIHHSNVNQGTNLPSNNQPQKQNPSVRMSVDSQESDELMMQLEKLFQGDPNDDDLFDSALCDTMESITNDGKHNTTQCYNSDGIESCAELKKANNSLIENQATQLKSLDERLAVLTGLLENGNKNNNIPQVKSSAPKPRKLNSNKWLCEEHFLKSRFFETLDEIGDCNRRKLSRIKQILSDLFGDDSDDEGVASPLEETPQFVVSCKERIAPWVIKLLTPYYMKGSIRGKTLFKSLAKHLIRLIYLCSRYPKQCEVNSFVEDFLDNHKMIRCEADFKQFRIENI